MFIDLYCANINPGIGKTFSFAHYIDVNQILLKILVHFPIQKILKTMTN